ncbi:MAG: FKBP-type peptidyl-prolyl cis-trans isomerase [Bacteroidota bacterium]|nr:FKBP-type peptidyl-prolyl cis-trans isomerase [Bacteroidota bacterium]
MIRIKFSILSLMAFLVFMTSCSIPDTGMSISDWKIKNDSYFAGMKDSTGYTLYTIPASRGGSNFYYKITVPGNQASVSPVSTDQVVVNYRGKLINGNVFDQTYTGAVPPNDSTATPGTFYPKFLIRGWLENLIQMKVGETRTIVLPQELGYGATGSGIIPPYSVTIFQIQLVKVK